MFKVDVKLSMLVSILLASIIAISLQKYKINQVIHFIIFGFHLDKFNPLQNIIKGGGIISMWKASLVVFISSALSGIFNGTKMLYLIENILLKAKTRFNLYVYTLITSIIIAAIGCNQSIAIIITNHLMNKVMKI